MTTMVNTYDEGDERGQDETQRVEERPHICPLPVVVLDKRRDRTQQHDDRCHDACGEAEVQCGGRPAVEAYLLADAGLPLQRHAFQREKQHRRDGGREIQGVLELDVAVPVVYPLVVIFVVLRAPVAAPQDEHDEWD